MVDEKKDVTPAESLTWEDLGFSKEYIEERTKVKYDGDLFVDPPERVIKEAVEACVAVVKEQELIKNKRMNRSFLWRFWYWLRS